MSYIESYPEMSLEELIKDTDKLIDKYGVLEALKNRVETPESVEEALWVFGNHTMQMLKELDSDIRFLLIKK